jgi:hypothetical protein
VALSMEEQRILAEMERNLAADDPRLASRLTSFGQQGLPGTVKSQRVRTIAGLLALAMIAAVTITMFMLSPYVNGRRADQPRTHPTAGASAAPAATTHNPVVGNASNGTKIGARGNAGKTAAVHGTTAKGTGSTRRSATAPATGARSGTPRSGTPRSGTLRSGTMASSKAGTSKTGTSKNSASRSASH